VSFSFATNEVAGAEFMDSNSSIENRLDDPDHVQRPLALVTGASSGIGKELAVQCAKNGFDLLVVADDPSIYDVAVDLRRLNVNVDAVQADLSTTDGVDHSLEATQGRPVEALLANAGHGLGGGFLDQDFEQFRHVIDTNITGTLYLIQRVGRQMRESDRGRILITGSVAGYTPGTYSAVYNGTKAFIDSFSYAIRAELKDTGVTVTCLMPGATETEFFERASMMDTRVGQSEKDDPADVARVGFEAMMRGDAEVVSGWKNKLLTTVAAVTPAGVLAEQQRRMAEPGGAERTKDTESKSKRSLKASLIAGGVLAGAGVAYMLLKEKSSRDVQAETSIVIDRSPAEVFSFWRDFTNLPLFMNHLESVEVLDDQRSHWTVKRIAGTNIEWDAEIYNEIPNELISWRSKENADIVNAGTVRFEEAPEGRGTTLYVSMNYNPPGAVLGTTVADLFGDEIETAIKDDLRRCKQLIETGEIASIEGQPTGAEVPRARAARMGHKQTSDTDS